MDDFDIKARLKTLPASPGVYLFYDADGFVLYVGKAKNLKNRVSSYFRGRQDTSKTVALVKKVSRFETIITHTEKEALILENNLIKEHKPRYNILFRDDKSYPFVAISQEPFAQIFYHRGIKKKGVYYYGPYPDSSAAKDAIKLLEKIFKLRTCDKSFFSNRSRPCLKYQVNRCSAPCVDFISQEDYQKQIKMVRQFLSGQSREVLELLTDEMKRQSENMLFEEAAKTRDILGNLRQIVEEQVVEGGDENIDIFSVAGDALKICISLLRFRQGKLLSRDVWVYSGVDLPDEPLPAFVTAYYLEKKADDIPLKVFLSTSWDWQTLNDVLDEKCGRKVQLTVPQRGKYVNWLKLAETNAKERLKREVHDQQQALERLQNLALFLGVSTLPKTMECFDISHTMGENTVASCVVFENGAPQKKRYRSYNIKSTDVGDDYGAMREVLCRRFKSLKNKPADLIVIDGGVGQYNLACEVLAEFNFKGAVLSVVKGEGRKHQNDSVLYQGKRFELNDHSDAKHLLQWIRDEAHRFAIKKHRTKQRKVRKNSLLDSIPGVGPKKRQLILSYFAGLKGLESASIADMMKVPGVGPELAKTIHEWLHENKK